MNIFLVLFKSFSGLDSILFAISVDNAELNAVRQVSNVINVGNVAVSPSRAEEEPRPVIAGDSSSGMLAIPHKWSGLQIKMLTVKPVLSSHSKRRSKLVFETDYHLMQVKSIAGCSKGSILQYFRPSLSYHLSLRSLFCLFLSGPLRQVLLYLKILNQNICCGYSKEHPIHMFKKIGKKIIAIYTQKCLLIWTYDGECINWQ